MDLLEILVVDNCSGENHLAPVRSMVPQFPNIQILELQENKGYFGAANVALTYYLSKKHELPEWVIVSNADVIFDDEQFFEKLLSHESDVLGVLAPRITVPSQKLEQNPFMMMRPNSWRQFTMRFYSSWYPLGMFWDWMSRQKRYIYRTMFSFPTQESAREIHQEIYAAHGSFLIFSRKYFTEGGFLDDGLFLFGEEIAVAETCRRLDLKVVYDSRLHVLHDEHSSVGRGMSRIAYHHHRQSVRYLFSKYLHSN